MAMMGAQGDRWRSQWVEALSGRSIAQSAANEDVRIDEDEVRRFGHHDRPYEWR
jgi:hypothetical protein